MLRRDVTHRWHSCSQTLRRACDATTAGTSVLLLPEAERSLVLRCSGLWQQRCHDNRDHKLLAREVCQSSRRSPDHNSGARQRRLTLCPLCGSRLLSVLSRQCVARLQLLRLRPRCEPERAVAAAASVLCGAAGQNAAARTRKTNMEAINARDASSGFCACGRPHFPFRPHLRDSSAEHRPAAANES